MQPASIAALAAVGLVLLRLAAELWLARMNRQHVLRHSASVPQAFSEMIDPATYRRSVEYTLAKSRFDSAEALFDAGMLLLVLFSGILPATFDLFASHFGQSTWSMAACLFLVGTGISILGLPGAWYHQFRLEERFGFNTTTPRTWWTDRLKGLLLSGALGYPLLVLMLWLIQRTGPLWWLWAATALIGFQLLIMVVAPILIFPLFNKFTPLPEGSLRERLLKLARRTEFRARSIQVMDGSKRSRHSNAFFTGFGSLRKIVLFDTLLQQLSDAELEAVLAHEIGHYKKGHIPKMLLLSTAGSLLGFYVLSVLARQGWFFEAFGFDALGGLAPALLLFALLGGAATFWISPLAHWLSRHHEYEADAFAAKVLGEPESLISALRKLNEKNLSNLTPHPVYSGFYYSHPAFLEREQALRLA